MAQPLDLEELMARARRWLATEPLSGSELAARLGVSQPTVSRLLREYRTEVLTTGRARRSRHTLLRRVSDVETPAPVFEIDAAGASRRVATLHPIGAAGFYVESFVDEIESARYLDWPWFLHQLRPGGFLGRRLGGHFLNLGLPEEPRNWSGDQLLRYLNHHGFSGSGALVVGEPALEGWLREGDVPRGDEEPDSLYPALVENVLGGAAPGSSAEGEQPKFLVARSASRPERLVKFSPPIREIVGRRVADLLFVEHHALRVLEARGVRAAASRVFAADGRVFLETERFDRTTAGRVGLLSLEAFDLEFVGDGRRNAWPSIVRKLVDVGRVPRSVLGDVDRLHAFGHLLGNNDMHTGNLSFVVRGHRILDVAPAYDTAPMFFGPLRGEIPKKELMLAPGPEVARSVWLWAIEPARSVWRAVADDAGVSPAFRKLAKNCERRVEDAAKVVSRLPE